MCTRICGNHLGGCESADHPKSARKAEGVVCPAREFFLFGSGSSGLGLSAFGLAPRAQFAVPAPRRPPGRPFGTCPVARLQFPSEAFQKLQFLSAPASKHVNFLPKISKNFRESGLINGLRANEAERNRCPAAPRCGPGSVGRPSGRPSCDGLWTPPARSVGRPSHDGLSTAPDNARRSPGARLRRPAERPSSASPASLRP
jgi:hypothetical protein